MTFELACCLLFTGQCNQYRLRAAIVIQPEGVAPYPVVFRREEDLDGPIRSRKYLHAGRSGRAKVVAVYL